MSTPVLGLASNMDQHLNMDGVQRLGAGILLRSEKADRAAVRAAVIQVLEDSRYSGAASKLARILAAYDAPSRFRGLLLRVAGEGFSMGQQKAAVPPEPYRSGG